LLAIRSSARLFPFAFLMCLIPAGLRQKTKPQPELGGPATTARHCQACSFLTLPLAGWLVVPAVARGANSVGNSNLISFKQSLSNL